MQNVIVIPDEISVMQFSLRFPFLIKKMKIYLFHFAVPKKQTHPSLPPPIKHQIFNINQEKMKNLLYKFSNTIDQIT